MVTPWRAIIGYQRGLRHCFLRRGALLYFGPFRTREIRLVPTTFLQSLAEQTEALKSQGLYKTERLIAGPQQAEIDVRSNGGVQHVINLCANNYLGLANHPEVIAAAHKALDEYGYGMASVRFICGTQTLHKELEQRISEFLGTEDTILYPSCFDANGGLFETILGNEDAVITDALNHASIIDGIRLSKAQRFRYQHNDMQDLEAQLQAASDANVRLIVSDGVFSMDGTIADLNAICDLAKQHDALTMIDDCHATGFLGDTGRGTHEYRGVDGPRRHHHGHARQGARRRVGRFYLRSQGDRRLAAAAISPLPVLEFGSADYRRHVNRGSRSAGSG